MDLSLMKSAIGEKLVPHLLNLFTKTGIEAKISVRAAVCHQADRKELARELCREVTALRT